MTVADILAWAESVPASVWIREASTIWAYPTVLTLHTVGLAILVGASAALDLRLLGFGRAIPLSALAKSFRLMWIGFWLNTVSGVALFAAQATSNGASTVFRWKLGVIALCVLNIWLIQRAVYGRDAQGRVEGAVPKLLALSSLVLWVVAIALGRWMAYAAV